MARTTLDYESWLAAGQELVRSLQARKQELQTELDAVDSQLSRVPAGLQESGLGRPAAKKARTVKKAPAAKKARTVKKAAAALVVPAAAAALVVPAAPAALVVPAAPAARTRKRREGKTLRVVVEEVLRGAKGPMTVKELEKAVLRAGYKTQAKRIYNAVFANLKILGAKRVGHGQYALG